MQTPGRGTVERARCAAALSAKVLRYAGRHLVNLYERHLANLYETCRCAGLFGFRRPVAAQKALWRKGNHRGRRPAVWTPSDAPVIDRGVLNRVDLARRHAGLPWRQGQLALTTWVRMREW